MLAVILSNSVPIYVNLIRNYLLPDLDEKRSVNFDEIWQVKPTQVLVVCLSKLAPDPCTAM